MKTLFVSLVGITTLLGAIHAAETNQSKLSEINQLRAENYKLKYNLSQCQVRVTDDQLTAERVSLEQQFRKEMKADETEKFDWNTLSFSNSISNSK